MLIRAAMPTSSLPPVDRIYATDDNETIRTTNSLCFSRLWDKSSAVTQPQIACRYLKYQKHFENVQHLNFTK